MKEKEPKVKTSPSWIPENWTFADKGVAENFDAHVREQLPWYDLVTGAVVHFGRHYIPTNGLVYDIGASTGNIARALAPTLELRGARIVSIEKEKEMAELYHGPGDIVVADALSYPFAKYDFGVCFLVLMFMPVKERMAWLKDLIGQLNPGGALVIVDKTITPSGFVGTAMRRLPMDWKLNSGAKPKDIIIKELSLAGVQRPLSQPHMSVSTNGSELVEFFRMGEFCGWIIERVGG